MISDSFPGQSYEVDNNISLAVELESETEIQTIYEQLSQKGSSINGITRYILGCEICESTRCLRCYLEFELYKILKLGYYRPGKFYYRLKL